MEAGLAGQGSAIAGRVNGRERAEHGQVDVRIKRTTMEGLMDGMRVTLRAGAIVEDQGGPHRGQQGTGARDRGCEQRQPVAGGGDRLVLRVQAPWVVVDHEDEPPRQLYLPVPYRYLAHTV